MRLFAAVYPPADELAALDARLGDSARDETGLRFVPLEQRHVTVAVFGNVNGDVVPGLSTRLARAASRTPVLSLRLSGAGTFPKQAVRARVLWAGLTGDVPELTRLAERCAAAARRCGVVVEGRELCPHLTLGRSRREPIDARAIVERLASYDGKPWSVGSLRLVHSTLGSKVKHDVLAEFPLAAHHA
jgi:2'-5' RNA ligase